MQVRLQLYKSNFRSHSVNLLPRKDISDMTGCSEAGTVKKAGKRVADPAVDSPRSGPAKTGGFRGVKDSVLDGCQVVERVMRDFLVIVA